MACNSPTPQVVTRSRPIFPAVLIHQSCIADGQSLLSRQGKLKVSMSSIYALISSTMIQTISSFTLRTPPQNGLGLHEQRTTSEVDIYKLVNLFNNPSFTSSLQRPPHQFQQWRPQSLPLSPPPTRLGAHYPWSRS